MHLQFKVNSKSLFFKNKSFLSINFSTFPITFFTWNVFLLSQLSRSLATHLQFKANSKPPADYRHEYPPLKRKKKKRKIPGYGAKSGRILTAKKRNWGKGNWLAFELTVTTVNELVPTAEFRLSISRIANPVSRVIGSEARLSAAPPFGRKSVRTAERLGTGVERVTVPNRHPNGHHISSSFEYSTLPISKWNIPFPWLFESRFNPAADGLREEIVSSPSNLSVALFFLPTSKPRDLRKNCRVLRKKHHLWNANTIPQFSPCSRFNVSPRGGEEIEQNCAIFLLSDINVNIGCSKINARFEFALVGKPEKRTVW